MQDDDDDDDDNDDPMILNNRAKNHTPECTIVPWTVIFMQDVPRMFPGPSLAGTGDGMSGNLRMNHISLWTPAWALKSGGTTRERPRPQDESHLPRDSSVGTQVPREKYSVFK